MLFVNAKKIKELNIDKELAIRCVVYCQEFALRFLFVPDKVETLSMVVNCADFSLWGAGGGSIKAILSTMSSQYTGRLFKMYIMRAGAAVNVLFSFLASRQK